MILALDAELASVSVVKERIGGSIDVVRVLVRVDDISVVVEGCVDIGGDAAEVETLSSDI